MEQRTTEPPVIIKNKCQTDVHFSNKSYFEVLIHSSWWYCDKVYGCLWMFMASTDRSSCWNTWNSHCCQHRPWAKLDVTTKKSSCNTTSCCWKLKFACFRVRCAHFCDGFPFPIISRWRHFTLTLPHRLVNLMQGASLSWRVCFNMFKTCSTSICKKPCKVPLDISGSGLSKTFFGRRGGAKCSGLKSYSLNRRSQRSPLDLGKHAANAWRYLKIPLWDIARHLSFCLVNVGRWRRNATTSCSAVGHWIWQCVKTLYPWWTSK